MKVLMFGWEFPPHISGGLGTACFGLTRAMTQSGTDVTFVLPRLRDAEIKSHVKLIDANKVIIKQVKEEQEAGKKITEIPIDSPLSPYMTESEYQVLLKRVNSKARQSEILSVVKSAISGEYGRGLMLEVFRYSSMAEYIAKTSDFDVIHAHDWMTFNAGIAAKKIGEKPLVVHIHALEFDRSGERVNKDIYEIEKKGMEAADRVITVSHYTKDIIVRKYGINEAKIRVVHNAVSKEKQIEKLSVEKPFDEKLVLFLGRITFQKGPDYFLEAAKKVIDRMHNVRFVMAGSGDMFQDMVEKMAELGIAKHFHFTGFLRGTEVEKIYAMSDLYVMPSVSEPFGIAPLEAMVYNVPIIISKQSGVAEVLPNAVKMDFWDTDLLAEKIITILTDTKLTNKLIEENKKVLQEIKWEKAAQNVSSVYHEILC